MTLSKRELALGGLLIIVIGIYLLYNFVFHPLNIQITQMKQENSSLCTLVQVLESEGIRPGDIWINKQQIWDDYAKILIKIPPTPMVPTVIDFMEQSARESNVKLLSISYQESSSTQKAMDANKYGTNSADQIKPTLKASDFQIAAGGTHYNLLAFILKVENAPRLYRINSINMIMVRKKQPKVDLGVEPLLEGANSNNEVFTDIKEKESQTYDINQQEIVLNLTAFYDRPDGSDSIVETSQGLDY